MRTSISALILFIAAGFAGTAWSGDCGYQNCWGAVGIGSNGQWGWSAEYSSESGAVAKVRAECPGCDRIETFYNTCGAMATGSGNAWGFGWASSRGQAEGNALGYCSDYGYGCQTVVWACTH